MINFTHDIFSKTKRLAILFLFLSSFGAYSQTCDITLRNDSLIDANNLIVDIYVKATSGDFYYGQGQYKVSFNTSIKNSGTITGTIIPGFSDLTNPSQIPSAVAISATYFRVNALTAPTLQTLCSMVSSAGNGTRICRVKLTNTASFGVFPANMLLIGGAPGATTVWYMNASNAVVAIPASYVNTNLVNPTLNGPITATYNVTGSGTSPSVVGLDGSQTPGVNYWLYKNTVLQAGYVNGTGSPITFGIQTAGTYTVKGHRQATYMFADMPGSAFIINAAWTGALSSDWETPGNWTPVAAPGPGLNAYIPAGAAHMPVVNALPASPAVCNNLTIEPLASVTVAAGKALTVNGTLVNNAGFNGLVVESDGSLIQSSAVLATVKRTINAWTAENGWHLLASPVTAQLIAPNFTTVPDNTYDFYAWWEPTNIWVNYKNTTVAPTWNTANNGLLSFIPGKGYLVAYAATSTKLFAGTLNKDNVTVNSLGISSPPTGATYYGWHLLGNPFSSALSWYTGWTQSNIAATAKIWNQGGGYTDVSAGGIIPAEQGFMVQVVTGTGSITIPTSARTHNSLPWYKATGDPYIKLIAHNPAAQTYQESVLMFDNQATPGYDPYFDSHFLSGYAPQFYSVDGSEHLSTNVLKDITTQTVVPFSFVKTAGTSFTIEAAQIDNVLTPVYLTDLKTNQTQNLVTNPVYSFTATDGDDPARFLLSFSNVGMGENSGINNGIYSYENNLYLVNPGKAKLEVYSLTGQKLLTQEINSPFLYKTTLNVPTSYYVVRLTTGTKVVVTRVFIKS